MNTHTPGPWRIGDNGQTVFGPPTALPAPVLVAELPFPSPRVPKEQRKANAALIAAAPELLAALEACQELLSNSDVRFMICDGGSGNLGEQAAYHRADGAARAAIRKAKGSL